MEELKEFFENVRVIRQILERKEADKVTAVIAPEIGVPVQTQIPTQTMQGQAIQQQAPVQTQVPVQQIPVAQNAGQAQVMPMPTTSQAESFTQEQIAVAMSRAQTLGRMDLIQQIFNTFGVQTLMQINPANYNQIAVMLREAGIEV